MYLRNRLKLFISFACIVFISGCGGLGGEPQIVATLPPQTPVPTDIGYPVQMPDLQIGAQVYAERCVLCHGTEGAGDGELIGNGPNQIAQAPRSFIDPATSADQTPMDWFLTITNGRIENLMPPWKEELSEADRWSVAFYTYLMHLSPEEVATGQTLAEQNSIDLNQLPSLEQQSALSDSTLLNLVSTTNSGLTPEEQRSLAGYVRTLYLSNPDQIGNVVVPVPAATEDAGSSTDGPVMLGTVTGRVQMGTEGASLPDDLSVTLNIVDDQFNNQPIEIPAATDGSFEFSNVPIYTDRNYLVTTSLNGRVFGSQPVLWTDGKVSVELFVSVYEASSDPAIIEIAGMVSQISAVDNTLQVAQVYSIVNNSDVVYSTDEVLDQNRFAGLRFPVPKGATVLSAGVDQFRYLLSIDNTEVIDTALVLPGREHIIQIVYTLPYDGQATVSQTIPYALNGPVRLLVTPDSIRVMGDGFPSIGPQTLRSFTYQGYGSTFVLPAGSILSYSIEGAAMSSSTASTSPVGVVTAENLLPIILFVIGAVAVAGSLIVYWRSRQRVQRNSTVNENQSLVNGLIRELAELDDMYAAGNLEDVHYEERRSHLKKRLADLIDEMERSKS